MALHVANLSYESLLVLFLVLALLGMSQPRGHLTKTTLSSLLYASANRCRVRQRCERKKKKRIKK